MATTFSVAQTAKLVAAAEALEMTMAHQTPFDADTIQRVAVVAKAKGFTDSEQAFMDAVKDNPHSTYIRFLLFMAGT